MNLLVSDITSTAETNKFTLTVNYGDNTEASDDVFKFTLDPNTQSIVDKDGKPLVKFQITSGDRVSLPDVLLQQKLSELLIKYRTEAPKTVTDTMEENKDYKEEFELVSKYIDDRKNGKPIPPEYEKKVDKLIKALDMISGEQPETVKEMNKNESIIRLKRPKQAPEVNEKLGPKATIGTYIEDFEKSDAPQFAGKSDEKKHQMAVAAYLKNKPMKEDLDLGHQDDEPGMLLGDLYSIMKSTKELYEMVSQFEGQGEVDFPHWWQAKIIKAKSCLQAANQYLDYEVNKPQQVQNVQVVALQEKKGTCCHKCGHVHKMGTPCPKDKLTGKDSCAFKKVNEATTPQDVTATTGNTTATDSGEATIAALRKMLKDLSISNISGLSTAEIAKIMELIPAMINKGAKGSTETTLKNIDKIYDTQTAGIKPKA